MATEERFCADSAVLNPQKLRARATVLAEILTVILIWRFNDRVKIAKLT